MNCQMLPIPSYFLYTWPPSKKSKKAVTFCEERITVFLFSEGETGLESAPTGSTADSLTNSDTPGVCVKASERGGGWPFRPGQLAAPHDAIPRFEDMAVQTYGTPAKPFTAPDGNLAPEPSAVTHQRISMYLVTTWRPNWCQILPFHALFV